MKKSQIDDQNTGLISLVEKKTKKVFSNHVGSNKNENEAFKVCFLSGFSCLCTFCLLNCY